MEHGSDSIRAIATNLFFALKAIWAIFAAVWIIGAFTSKRSVRRQSWASRFGMVGCGIIGYFLLFAAARYFGFVEGRFLPNSAIYLWIGLFMTLIGVMFAFWARAILGRNWSGIVTVKQNHELIRTGPYALVRHPIYTGVLFALLGTIIFDGTIATLISLFVVLSVFTYKMKIEEQFMGEQFGSQYASYRQKTKALVPFLW
jgi:protein-S-isoprenylcysteine O-methyltransferase Ste14